MKKYMNEPLEYTWTEADVVKEYQKCKDKKKVAGIFCITTKDVATILKNKGM